jgi:thiosulfate/3-mercaptopyruvate sulfurtransferase
LALVTLALALALGAPLSHLSRGAQAATSLPGPLVTVQWLHDHLNDVTVIDIRDDIRRLTVQPTFDADKSTGKKTLIETGGHIPGALFVDFTKIREDRIVDGVKLTAMMPTKEYFENVMDTAGLDRGMMIVIAATGENVESVDMATRLFFQLKYFGEDNIALLNGGTNAWIGAGYPVSTDAMAAKKGNWVATTERKELLATTEDVKESLRSGATQLIDARPIVQFFGITKSPVVLAAGHVEGARSLPAEAVVRPVSGARELMTASQYLAIFKEQSISPDKPSIAYCNTGHYASGAWFVAHEILKNSSAKLYPGSMNEWTHLGNPVVGLPQ